jgi:shikimate kinase
MSRALVLVGLSGSGKSTVGRLLASRLSLPFIDTDRQVELRAGMSIAEMFARMGEEEFRRQESAMLVESCAGQAVVATGGGAVLRAENRDVLRADNLVVWIDVPVPLLVKRLNGHTQGEERPLLRADNLYTRLERLSLERHALYRASSHVRCEVPEDAHLGSRRIAADLAGIYKAWIASERTLDDSRSGPGRRRQRHGA